MYVIWALGRLDKTNNEPSFHDLYPRNDVVLELNRKDAENSCIDFTESSGKFSQKCLLMFHTLYNQIIRFAILILSLALFSENLGRKQKYSTEAFEPSKQLSDPPVGEGDIRESRV